MNFIFSRTIHPSRSVARTPQSPDPWLTTVLEQRHAWSASGILDEIRREQFDVVFTNRVGPRISPAMLRSLAMYYQPLCQTSTMIVMKPMNRPTNFSVADSSYTLRDTCK